MTVPIRQPQSRHTIKLLFLLVPTKILGSRFVLSLGRFEGLMLRNSFLFAIVTRDTFTYKFNPRQNYVSPSRQAGWHEWILARVAAFVVKRYCVGHPKKTGLLCPIAVKIPTKSRSDFNEPIYRLLMSANKDWTDTHCLLVSHWLIKFIELEVLGMFLLQTTYLYLTSAIQISGL